MGNGVMAIGPQLPRPSSTLPLLKALRRPARSGLWGSSVTDYRSYGVLDCCSVDAGLLKVRLVHGIDRTAVVLTI